MTDTKIILKAEPNVVKTWEDFKKENAPFAIALDGYVKGKTQCDVKGPYQNFNHHEEVDRLFTRSTCSQVQIGMKQGLFNLFSRDNRPYAEVYVNDPDQDTCLAVWLLRNPDKVLRVEDKIINRLIQLEDLLDATGGTYPVSPSDSMMKKIAWIFENYTNARMKNSLHKISPSDMGKIIDDTGRRISDYWFGRGDEIDLDRRYEEIYKDNYFTMIKEVGPYARNKLAEDGINVYVMANKREDGNFSYVIGRISPYVDYFDHREISKALNEKEGIQEKGNADSWGGGSTIIGSPRVKGSQINPDEMQKILSGIFLKK